MTPRRWVAAAVAVVLVVCLLVWARGDENHRRGEAGADPPVALTQPTTSARAELSREAL